MPQRAFHDTKKRIPRTGAVRLAELMAALSQATDIGLGTAPEHAQRSALVTVALADAAGLPRPGTAGLPHVAQDHRLHGDEDVTARIFGEDAGTWIAHIGGASPIEAARRRRPTWAGQRRPLRRARKVLRALGTCRLPPVTRGHCEVGHLLAQRLGLSPGVVRGMNQVFERWDGQGRRPTEGRGHRSGRCASPCWRPTRGGAADAGQWKAAWR